VPLEDPAENKGDGGSGNRDPLCTVADGTGAETGAEASEWPFWLPFSWGANAGRSLCEDEAERASFLSLPPGVLLVAARRLSS